MMELKIADGSRLNMRRSLAIIYTANFKVILKVNAGIRSETRESKSKEKNKTNKKKNPGSRKRATMKKVIKP